MPRRVCWRGFELQSVAILFGVGLIANNETASARDQITVCCVGDHGVGGKPTIFPEPEDEAN